MTGKKTWGERRAELKELAGQAWRRLRGGELTPWRAALSVGVGLVIGMTPAFGLHWLIILLVCVPLRLDAGVAYLAANISLPFIAPFITFAEIEVGALILHGEMMSIAPGDLQTIGLKTLVAELALGTAILAPAGGALGGAIAYAVVAWRRRRKRKLRREGADEEIMAERSSRAPDTREP